MKSTVKPTRYSIEQRSTGKPREQDKDLFSGRVCYHMTESLQIIKKQEVDGNIELKMTYQIKHVNGKKGNDEAYNPLPFKEKVNDKNKENGSKHQVEAQMIKVVYSEEFEKRIITSRIPEYRKNFRNTVCIKNQWV